MFAIQVAIAVARALGAIAEIAQPHARAGHRAGATLCGR